MCAFNKQKEIDLCSVFVDELLVEGESFLRSDVTLRKNFVEFIKGGAWAEDLESFEDYSSSQAPSKSLWRRFGYMSPSMSLNGIATNTRKSFEKLTGGNPRVITPRNLSCDSGSSRGSKSCPVYQKMVLEELYTAIGDCDLFGTDDLRAVLIAALLPLFLSSSEYKASASTSLDDYDVPEVSVGDIYGNQKPPTERPKSERLQAWLSGAAAMFDSSELEAYLMDPRSSLVDDYIRALKALPAAIAVDVVDVEKKEASVLPFSSKLLSVKSTPKSNIPATFCADMTVHDVERAEQAMGDAKTYKQGVVCSNGMYQLRALKPVFNSHDSCVYALSVKSAHFEDPIMQEKDENDGIVADKSFQQVDNLLLLLPLLIRNFSASPDAPGFAHGSASTKVA